MRARRLSGLLGVVVSLVAATAIAAPQLTIDVTVAEPASVFNFVERASKWRDPSDDGDPHYLELWQSAVGTEPRDAEMFARYRALRRRCRGSLQPGGLVTALADAELPLPVARDRVLWENKLALLFLAADHWEDVWQGARLLLSAKDQATLQEVFEYFRRRLARPLRRGLYLDAYRARATAQLAHPAVRRVLARLVTFLDLAPATTLQFHVRLVWLPGATEHTRAMAIEDHAAVEVAAGLPLDHVVEVVIHEAVHRLVERMPLETRRRLELAFLKPQECSEDGATCVVAASLFEEVLPTAVGQGVLGETLGATPQRSSQTWYDDTTFDAVAKAIAPMVRRYLGEGLVIDAAFAKGLVKAYASAEARPPTERDLWRQAILLYENPADEHAVSAWLRQTSRVRLLLDYPVGDARATAARAAFPALPVLVLDRPDTPLPPAFAPGVGAQVRADGVRWTARPHAGPIVVVEGDDPSAFQRRLDSWLGAAKPSK